MSDLQQGAMKDVNIYKQRHRDLDTVVENGKADSPEISSAASGVLGKDIKNQVQT